MNMTRAEAQPRNNYIGKIYSSPPPFSLQKKIDLITLSSIDPREQDPIDALLVAHGFKAISDLMICKGHFAMKRTYQSESDQAAIEIFHSPRSSFEGRPTLLITIHDPDESLFDLFHSFFQMSWYASQGIEDRVGIRLLCSSCQGSSSSEMLPGIPFVLEEPEVQVLSVQEHFLPG
jgi:hypothetical protein